MKTFQVTYSNNAFTIFDGDLVYATIEFLKNSRNALIHMDSKTYVLSPDSDKNMLLKLEDTLLFKFQFQYLWGQIKLLMNGEDHLYSIKGKWFKTGTYLCDTANRDLLKIYNNSIGFKIECYVPAIDKILVACTTFQHIVSSKTLLLNKAIYQHN